MFPLRRIRAGGRPGRPGGEGALVGAAGASQARSGGASDSRGGEQADHGPEESTPLARGRNRPASSIADPRSRAPVASTRQAGFVALLARKFGFTSRARQQAVVRLSRPTAPLRSRLVALLARANLVVYEPRGKQAVVRLGQLEPPDDALHECFGFFHRHLSLA